MEMCGTQWATEQYSTLEKKGVTLKHFANVDKDNKTAVRQALRTAFDTLSVLYDEDMLSHHFGEGMVTVTCEKKMYATPMPNLLANNAEKRRWFNVADSELTQVMD